MVGFGLGWAVGKDETRGNAEHQVHRVASAVCGPSVVVRVVVAGGSSAAQVAAVRRVVRTKVNRNGMVVVVANGPE